VTSSAAGRLFSAIVLAAAMATAPLSTSALAFSALVATLAAISLESRRTRLALVPAAFVIAGSLVPVAVSSGLEHAGRVAIRALAAAMTAIAVAGTIPTHELAPALTALGIPSAVATVIGSALRQASVLVEEGRRLLLARQLRGSAGHREGATILGVLLSRAAARAERIELAARLRGCSPAHATRRARLAWADAPAVVLACTLGLSIHVAGHFFR
jgi:energy-coupling factor transporter transmembrane protein EcfT